MTPKETLLKIKKVEDRIRRVTPKKLKLFIPISGGTDSALTFFLYTKLFKKRVVGIYFGTNLENKTWFEKTGTVVFMDRYSGYDKEVGRWSKLLEESLLQQALIIGTRNKTEDILGTFSHASRVSHILPIVNLYKSEVLEICEFLNFPKEMILSSRLPDPVCGRYDAYTSIGIERVDEIIKTKILGESGKQNNLTQDEKYIIQLYKKSGYKRNLPVRI